MAERTGRKRLRTVLFGLVLLLFPVALLQTYADQLSAPMPELHLLLSDPSIIHQVLPGSRAEAAGVQAGDVIRQLNGSPFNPEHLSRQVAGLRVGQLLDLDLELERDGQRFNVSIPLVSVGQVTRDRFILFSTLAFICWLASAVLVWQRFVRIEMRLLFFLGQAVSLGLLFPYVDVVSWFSCRSWVVGLSGTSGMLAAALLLHFHLTFPVRLGSPRQRRYLLGGLYGTGLALAAGWVTHNYTLYLPHVLGGMLAVYTALLVTVSVIVQAVVYLRHASPDGRRRLRVIMLGSMVAGAPPALFYLGASAFLGYPLISEWIMGLCLLVAPLAYIVATIQHNLFEIDRVLNRSLVYAILSLVILIFWVAPVSLIYWLIGGWPGHLIIVTGLLLIAAVVFERTRTAIQRLVDRWFYGGWYDYPAVVETISTALASSLEWEQLVTVLTRQAPVLMHLRGASLQVAEQFTPPLDPAAQPQLSFPLVFEDQASGVWVAGPRHDGEDFTAEDRRILQTLARQATIAVNNMLLVKRIRDQLVEIQASREQLALMDRQLLTTREAERARLARDLHDGPVQALIGLNLQLGLLASPPAGALAASRPEPVQTIRDEIKSVVYDLRSMCAELRPPMLDTLGLGAALRELAQQWSAQNCIRVRFEQLLPDRDLQSLPDEVAVNLYRVAQEALSNIARHANAREVQLRLGCDPASAKFCMCIQDNGQGFAYDPASRLSVQGHLGLMNMQERMALLGGEWQILTTPGQGTTIIALWGNRPEQLVTAGGIGHGSTG